MNADLERSHKHKVISLGWGVQSFTLAAMVALGELEPVSAAVFADTTFEASWTYQHRERWSSWLEERGVKVVTVQAERIEPIEESWNRVPMPVIALSKDGKKGWYGRQCTGYWKVAPLKRWLRSQGWLREGVELQLGISLDEYKRMKDSQVQYIKHRWPLIEKRMTRKDCVRWLELHGLDVPNKSSCYFCPLHQVGYWRELREHGNGDWEKAVAIDEKIRDLRSPDRLFLNCACEFIDRLSTRPIKPKQLEFEECDSGYCFV